MTTLRRGGRALLSERLDELVAIYRAAFLELHEPDPDRAAQERRAHMFRHCQQPGLDVVVAVDADEAAVGFVYSYPGLAGQWWHDVVAAGLDRVDPSTQFRRRWLADTREIVELHVRPEAQGRGTGRALLRAALDHATERTIVLSALDDPTSRSGPARRLYAAERFVALLEEFTFPGSPLPYAVLGRDRA
jgi:GNAT superfamily N-acetyltransferase